MDWEFSADSFTPLSLLIWSDEVSTSRDKFSEGMLISPLICLVESSVILYVIH